MPLKLFLFVPPKQPEPDALSELRRLRRALWADGISARTSASSDFGELSRVVEPSCQPRPRWGAR